MVFMVVGVWWFMMMLFLDGIVIDIVWLCRLFLGWL